jgi:hypothetical protein
MDLNGFFIQPLNMQKEKCPSDFAIDKDASSLSAIGGLGV